MDKEEVKFILKWMNTILIYQFNAFNITPFGRDKFDRKSFLKEVNDKFIEIEKDVEMHFHEKSFKRGLKESFNTSIDIAVHMDSVDLMTLNRELISLFGFGTDKFSKKQQNAIRKIIKKGKIKDADEFELLEQRVSTLSQQDISLEVELEIKEINNLLAAFEKR